MKQEFYNELNKEINKLPYTKGLDDGQFNEGRLYGFELGAMWAYDYLNRICEHTWTPVLEKGVMEENKSMEEMEKHQQQVWYDAVDFSNPPTPKNAYINITENKKRFIAQFPSDGVLATGVGGFLNWYEDYGRLPIKYNGKVIPIREVGLFLDYVKTISGT